MANDEIAIDPERFKERMLAAGYDPADGGQTRLAKVVKMTQGGINSILVGDSKRPRKLLELAVALNTTQEYLLGQTNDPRRAEAREKGRKIEAPKAVPLKAIGRRIPVFAWVAAGRLAQHHAQDVLGHIRIAELPKTQGKADWIALKVEGDSMDRISPPESIILVNRNEKTLIANACYIIDDGAGNATYKRYRPDPMRFEAVSINTEHQPIFPEEAPFIVGRVRRTILDM